jgi:hypothetical protein
MALTKVITGVTDLNQAQSTSGLKFPTGSVFAGTPEEGMIRNDQSQSSETSSSTMQFYNGTAWKNFVNKPIIPLGSDNFNTVLYTGNNSSQSVTTGFKPDFSWLKSRTGSYDHNLIDSVRGDFFINTNRTSAEEAGYNGVVFGNNGFTVAAVGGTTSGEINVSGQNYVSWNWKAGGAAVSNTDGSITSQVSANTAAGFSITKFVGDGGSSKTIGHGLTIQPNFVIFKRLNGAVNWFVFFKPAGGNTTGFEGLNTTNAAFSTNYTTFQPSTTTMTTNGVTADFNGSGNSYIMYSFHSVAGYSKIGSYTGNGSATGPTIVTGFEPAFVMLKCTTSSGTSWRILDNKRNTSNPRDEYLEAQDNFAEATSNQLNFNSNGFQVITTDTSINANGSNVIYLAFAAT